MATKTQNASNSMFPNFEQMSDSMRQMFSDSMTNMKTMNEDMTTMRQQQMAHMKTAADDYAQFVKASMDYQTNLFTEWQRLGTEAMQSMGFGANKG